MSNIDEPKRESRLLLGDELKLAQHFEGLSLELVERHRVLADRANKGIADANQEWEEAKAAMLPEIEAEKTKLWEANGITKDDPEYPMWRIDAQYFEEHGIMFLVKDVEAYKNEAVVDRCLSGKTEH